MKLSIIIPCFNEHDTIGPVLDRVRGVALPENLEREIIVVDDGSTDSGAERLVEYVARWPEVRLHRAVTNFGKGAAVRAGLALATGDIVLIQDADLELCPEEIPLLLTPILAGQCDVVYGSRFLGKRPMRWSLSYLANRIITWLARVLYATWLTDVETCYKVMRRSVLARMRLRSVGFEIEPELTAKLLRLGHAIREVPITYTPRTVAGGKKIRAWDGVKAVYYLVKYRVQPRARFVREDADRQ